jgi:TP901-1 family phage major tail protein|tara:strand:+ start:707 stop:1135 length:429 start_codon:yes stop_codon:yes gene_type:complete
MAKQLGRSLLLKIGDGASPDVYTAFAGLNSKSLTVNNSAIDVTTPDATTPGGALWAESLNGLKAVSVSGDGIFLDEAAQEGRLNTIAMAADPSANFQILVPGFGTYTGGFRVTSFEFGGETEGAVTFSLSLESSGETVFAAV